MAMFSVQKTKSLDPVKTWQRPLARKISAVVATAETFYVDIPRDHFIHEIHITVGEGTTPSGTLADDLVDIKLVGNGNKYMKDMLATMCKEVMKINKRKPATGMYSLFFTDPKIPEAQPLPAWVFTSLQLILLDNAPAASNYHYIDVVVVESAYRGEDLSNWHVLVEKYLKWQKWGTNTLWQLYEHERAYKIFGYLYLIDDNATPSDTIVDKLKVLGRKPEGEVTIVGEVPVRLLQAENNGELGLDTLGTGFCFLEWAGGFPANEFSSLYSYANIPSAGTNVGLRVLERYIL